MQCQLALLSFKTEASLDFHFQILSPVDASKTCETFKITTQMASLYAAVAVLHGDGPAEVVGSRAPTELCREYTP